MKDALGHGSNSHEVIDTHNDNKVMSQHPTFRKAFNATKKLSDTYEQKGGWQYQIRPIQSGATQNTRAAAQLASGPKSQPVPIHDSMGGYNGSNPNYNRDAVNNAISSSNRSGRRIGGKEASAIHRLLRGR